MTAPCASAAGPPFFPAGSSAAMVCSSRVGRSLKMSRPAPDLVSLFLSVSKGFNQIEGDALWFLLREHIEALSSERCAEERRIARLLFR